MGFESNKIDESNSLDKYLVELENSSKKMRIYGYQALIATSMNLICTFAGISIPLLYRNGGIDIPATTLLLLSIMFAFMFVAIISLLFFERIRERGKILLQELSDELHWGNSSSKKNEIDFSIEKPSIRYRISFRQFSASEKLPFVQASFGPTVYVVFNIALTILVLFRIPNVFY